MSVGSIIVTLCWVIGVGLIGAACLGLLTQPFATAGLAVIVFGCLRVVLNATRRITEAQQAAFELGQESVRVVRNNRV